MLRESPTRRGAEQTRQGFQEERVRTLRGGSLRLRRPCLPQFGQGAFLGAQ